MPRDRSKPFAGSMWAARPGDLVFSKIDVRNGAIGILPEGIGPAVVTGEYPVYSFDESEVSGGFLARLLRTPPFLDLLTSAASGTSGRKRVSREDFEALEVPLPGLQEQRALAAAHAGAYREAARAEAEADAAEAEAVAAFEAALGLTPPPDLPRQRSRIARFSEMERWSHEGALHAALLGGHVPESEFEIEPLEEVADVSYGLQKSPANRPGAHARPYLRVANVQRGYLNLDEVKEINVPDDEMDRFRLQPGDLLFVEGNGSRDQIGRVALWHGEIPDCVHQNHIIRARVDQERLDSEFAMEWFNTEAGREHFFRNAKTTSGLLTLNSTDIRTAPIPVPPSLDVQREITGALREARASVEAQRQSAAGTRAAANAAFAAGVFGEGAEAEPEEHPGAVAP